MPDISAIVASIDTRLDDLATEIAALHEARAALYARELLQQEPVDTTAAPARRRRAKSKKPAAKVASSFSGEQLERLLADARSGLSTLAIAERAGVARSRVLALLGELESAGKVRRTSERRSTLWLPITDEERIAQRAAELERQFAARRGDRTQRRGRARAS